MAMTKRENFLRALRRENPEWVPFDITLCPFHEENLSKKLGAQASGESASNVTAAGSVDSKVYFGVPFRYVEPLPTKKNVDYKKYYKNLPGNAQPLSWNPEWGIYSVPGSVAHFEEMLHPMEGFESPLDIRNYPFPDLNEAYRWESMAAHIDTLKKADLVSIAFMQMTIFEISWYLRGMDTFMMDMIDNREFAETLLDVVTDIRIGMAEKYARCGVDILMLGDDVSTQLDMMISPALWRELIKPRLTRIISSAKKIKPDLLVFYHGDGNLQTIIPDLIEIGVDILNPVQPECMDPALVKKEYGEKLSFWGTMGTQTTLPFGTPKDVEETVKQMIKTAGQGGGLVLAPTHTIEPDVPWENIEAFVNAVKKHGVY
jgi:uroporphyrinogen decarboxylase